MNRPAFKNIAVFSAAVIILCSVAYFVNQHDNRVVDLWNRNKYSVDSVYISVAERVEAIQFGDSILPALKQKGLITSIERNDLGTTVAVSGSLLKESAPVLG
jgi:hypothetical protein